MVGRVRMLAAKPLRSVAAPSRWRPVSPAGSGFESLMAHRKPGQPSADLPLPDHLPPTPPVAPAVARAPQSLTGEQLGSMVFATDYVRLHFDDSRLTCRVSLGLQVRAGAGT